MLSLALKQILHDILVSDYDVLNKFDFKLHRFGKSNLTMGGKHYNKKNNGIFKILEKAGFDCETSGKNYNKFFYKVVFNTFLV